MNVRKVERILVSQPKPSSDKSPYFEIAQKYNVDVRFKPFIKVERLPVKEFKSQKISVLDFTAIVFTARTAVDKFFSLCDELRITMPETMKYFCISEVVALYLQKYIVYRKRKIFYSTTGKIDGLDPSFTKHNKEKYLLPVSDQHNDEVVNYLEKKKIDFTKSIMYRTVSNQFNKSEIDGSDMILFFSPLGVQSLFDNYPDFKQSDLAIGCFGNTTAKALKDAKLRVDCEAPQNGHTSMTAALEHFLKANKKQYA